MDTGFSSPWRPKNPQKHPSVPPAASQLSREVSGKLAFTVLHTYNPALCVKACSTLAETRGAGRSPFAQCPALSLGREPEAWGRSCVPWVAVTASFPRNLEEQGMKKTLVSMVLVLTAIAVMEALSVLPAPAQQPSTAGQAAPAASQQKGPEIKDPAEYNAYVGAMQQSNPQAKASALESFLQQYPNSVMKKDALELLMAAYEQTGDTAKMQATADRLLQADPNNLRALALLAYSHRRQAEANQNPQQNLAAAAQYGEKGLQAIASAPKPDGMSDADWTKLKDQVGGIFNGAVGLSALQNKDFKSAEEHLRAAVNQNPSNLTDVYPLALAYYSAGNPPKSATPPPDPAVVDANVQGLFFIARAANLAGAPGQAQISDFGKKWFAKFHGSDQGWDELLASTKTQTLPPQGFTIAAAPPPPTPAQQAAQLVTSKSIK